jgi:thioredoxin-dependent peroxiredoxin
MTPCFLSVYFQHCQEEIIMLQEGNPAPAFELLDEGSRTVRLKDFQGHPLVLYFFPKADTPG